MEVADLTSILKSRQSQGTPKSADNHPNNSRSQSAQKPNEDYQSIKTQYSTNYYTSIKPSNNFKKQKQQIGIIHSEEHPGEFIAYCVAKKETNFGMDANERLIVLDSYEKELRYYSQVPSFPIYKLESLPPPKERVKILEVNKFSYVPAKRAIAEVTISWLISDKIKKWVLTMSSPEAVINFGALVEHVKKNSYLQNKPSDILKKKNEQVPVKVNLKETTFISELRQLDSKTSKVGKKEKMNDEQKPKIQDLSSKQKVEVIPASNKIGKSKEEVSLNLQRNEEKDTKVQTQAKQNSQKIKQQSSVQSAKQSKQPDKPQPKPEIQISKIIDVANVQYSKLLIKSPKSENKRFLELQNILNSRKNTQKMRRSSINSHDGNRLSESKAMVKKIEEPIEKETVINSPKYDLNRSNEKNFSSHKKSKYEQNYDKFRLSLLQQRRQNLNSESNKPNKPHPKRESVKNSIVKDELLTVKSQSWLQKWLNANSKQQLVQIYSKFIDCCKARVKKISLGFQNWRLIHKNVSEYQFEEEEIDFHYHVFQQNVGSQLIFCREEGLELRIKNWSYLLKFTRSLSNKKVKFAVPLACIVIYRGLKVFCKAGFNPMKWNSRVVEDITQYIEELRQIESECRLSLNRSQLYQIDWRDSKLLYFNELDALPKISLDLPSYVDFNYIRTYIDKGVVRNEFDLNQIKNHLRSKLIERCVERLNKNYILSTSQFEQLVYEQGLNLSFLVDLYGMAREKKCQRALTIIISEIISWGLYRVIRIRLNKFLLTERVLNVDASIYSSIWLFVKTRDELVEEIRQQIKLGLRIEEEIDFKAGLTQYIVSSALFKIGYRCQFKNKIDFSVLQNLCEDIWCWVEFDAENVNLYATVDSINYHHTNFIESELLQGKIFNKSISFGEEITRQKVIEQLSPYSPNFYQSEYYKVLSKNCKTKLNYYLSHFTPPHHKNLGLAFQYQYKQIYFNLYHHSTVYIQTYQSFSEDLIGIKWLIKKKLYEEAECKIRQQRQRVWIWARHHPRILIQIHDLQALFAQRTGRHLIAVQSSLISLRLAIHFFSANDKNWQIIWEKAFFAAEVHFQSNKLQDAAPLYEICQRLNENMKNSKFKSEEINEQFLDVYRKQAFIKLALGKIEECIEQSSKNMESFRNWKGYFSEDNLRVNILIKADIQLYESNRLLLRCYEIKNDLPSYHTCLSSMLLQYFQKDWNLEYLNNPRLKLTDILKNRFSDLIKCCWYYAVYNCEAINQELLQSEMGRINLGVVREHLQRIKRQNHGYYRYTTQELFKFMIQIVIESSEAEGKSNISPSQIIKLIVECLSELSNQTRHDRCKLYDEHSKTNRLLFLESITHLTGYQFCLGTIQEWLHTYNFSF